MTLKLKVGKKYRDRNGELVEIVDYQADPHYPFIGGNGNNYMESGRWARLSEDQRDLIEEVIEPAQEPVKKPHKHAELIKAWADGAEIQYKCLASGEWKHIEGDAPSWCDEFEYRIKPQEFPQWRKDLAQALEDGKVVQVKLFDKWVNTDLDSEYFLYSLRDLVEESYRIKPEPKPYCWGEVTTIPEDAVFINPHTGKARDARDVFSDPYGLLITHNISEPKPDVVETWSVSKESFYKDSASSANLKLTWDGETGKLKDAEVLK
jgi:hypothetical protein